MRWKLWENNPTENRRGRWLRNKGRDSITANWTRRDGISVLGDNGMKECEAIHNC